MIEQLIALIGGFWEQILPLYTIDQFEKAVVLRFGKFKKVVGPGLHWKMPFFDVIMSDSVVTDTYNLPPQSLTTSDNKEIVTSAVVRFHISDIKKFKLEITDEESAIQDICLGAIMTALTSKSWQDCQDRTINTHITNQVKKEVAEYGITVEKVRLTDLAKVRSIRLFGGTFV